MSIFHVPNSLCMSFILLVCKTQLMCGSCSGSRLSSLEFESHTSEQCLFVWGFFFFFFYFNTQRGVEVVFCTVNHILSRFHVLQYRDFFQVNTRPIKYVNQTRKLVTFFCQFGELIYTDYALCDDPLKFSMALFQKITANNFSMHFWG